MLYGALSSYKTDSLVEEGDQWQEVEKKGENEQHVWPTWMVMSQRNLLLCMLLKKQSTLSE